MKKQCMLIGLSGITGNKFLSRGEAKKLLVKTRITHCKKE